MQDFRTDFTALDFKAVILSKGSRNISFMGRAYVKMRPRFASAIFCNVFQVSVWQWWTNQCFTDPIRLAARDGKQLSRSRGTAKLDLILLKSRAENEILLRQSLKNRVSWPAIRLLSIKVSHNRKSYRKGRALAFAGTGSRDGPTVKFDQLANDCQAQTES
jgi:hypothetical protein